MSAEQMDQTGRDIVGIDVTRYARYLWRHSIILVSVTLVCGLLGGALSRLKTPVYIGKARLMVMQAGSGTAADAVVKYQGALQSETVLAAAVGQAQQSGASAMTVADLRGSLAWRLEFPPNSFVVEVRSTDADLAARMAVAVARAALDSARAQHVRQLTATRELLQANIVAAEQVLIKARADLAQFRAANAKELGAVTVPDVSVERSELKYINNEVPAERARLAIIEADLATAAVEPAEYRADLLKRASESRTRLAAFEAKRPRLAAAVAAADKRTADLHRGAALVQRDAELVADLNLADKAKNLVSDRNAAALTEGVAIIDSLQLIDAPLTATPVANRSAGVPRGLAVGLVLSVFGLLFRRGMRSPD